MNNKSLSESGSRLSNFHTFFQRRFTDPVCPVSHSFYFQNSLVFLLPITSAVEPLLAIKDPTYCDYIPGIKTRVEFKSRMHTLYLTGYLRSLGMRVVNG